MDKSCRPVYKSTVKVEGTSTVHDWEMNLKDMRGNVEFEINENQIRELEDSDFVCEVEDLDSDNSIMNRKAHKG